MNQEQNQENISIKIFDSPIVGCVGVIARIKDYVVRDPAVDDEKVAHFVARIHDHVAEFGVELDPAIVGDITLKIHEAIQKVRLAGAIGYTHNPYVVVSSDAKGLTLSVHCGGDSVTIGGIVNDITLDNAIDSAVYHVEGDEPSVCVTEAVKDTIREAGHNRLVVHQISGLMSKERTRIELFPKTSEVGTTHGALDATREELLANYRRLVGKLAVAKDKNEAWSIAKNWAPADLWKSIGFDLAEEVEQKAFLFGA